MEIIKCYILFVQAMTDTTTRTYLNLIVNDHKVAEAYAAEGLQYNEGIGMTSVKLAAGDNVFVEYGQGPDTLHGYWHTSFLGFRLSN